jgi:ABC-type branched-subunit amino acid transport system substrate-binding protein
VSGHTSSPYSKRAAPANAAPSLFEIRADSSSPGTARIGLLLHLQRTCHRIEGSAKLAEFVVPTREARSGALVARPVPFVSTRLESSGRSAAPPGR